ncbi:retrovirus-related pol polyprotein from transposon TNT 1-94 [Tanacetum coccineum]
MNMLNRNCKTSFEKPECLKKAQRANPRLYDIGCYNDNPALMLAPESDETICLANESRSKLSDLIRPFDYDQLNNLYDLFVPQREKSLEQQYFSKESIMSHTSANNEISKGSFHKQTTLLEKRMDESISWDQKCKSSKELFKIKRSVDTIFDGVERCKQTIAKRTYFALKKCERLEKELSKSRTMSTSFEALQKHAINLELVLQQCKPATFSDSLSKTDFSKSKSVSTNNVSNDFSKPVTAQILPQKVMTISTNTNVIAPGMYKVHTKPNQTRTPQLPQDIRKTNKRVSFSIGVIPTTSVNRPQLKSNQLEDRWYPKFTPSGYKWKPKSPIGNVNINVSMSLGNASRTTNILEPITPKCSTVSNTPLSSNSFASRRDNPIHRRLWVLKAHDGKSQAPKGLHAQVRIVQTDKGHHNLLNKTLHAYFATEGISHEMSVARTPEQNDIVERRNRTLVEVAQTMLSAAKVPH